jgi:hypothetical protein
MSIKSRPATKEFRDNWPFGPSKFEKGVLAEKFVEEPHTPLESPPRYFLWVNTQTGNSAEVLESTTISQLFDMAMLGVVEFRSENLLDGHIILGLLGSLKSLVLKRLVKG